MDWEKFSVGLAGELADYPRNMLLVISESRGSEGRYAQFSQWSHGLTAYLVVNSFLADPLRASAEGERAIMGAGWDAPDVSYGHDNWWKSVFWPPTSEQSRTLADMVATGLRDGYGIADPGGFVYRAWDEETGADIELPGLRLPRHE